MTIVINNLSNNFLSVFFLFKILISGKSGNDGIKVKLEKRKAVPNDAKDNIPFMTSLKLFILLGHSLHLMHKIKNTILKTI